MLTEEDLHALEFTKKEDPKNMAMEIHKISMRYKVKLPNSKKTAHVLRLGKVKYADVLAAKKGPVHKMSRDRAKMRNY